MKNEYSLTKKGDYYYTPTKSLGNMYGNYIITVTTTNKEFLERMDTELDKAIKRIINPKKDENRSVEEYIDAKIKEIDMKMSKMDEEDMDLRFNKVYAGYLIRKSTLNEIKYLL